MNKTNIRRSRFLLPVIGVTLLTLISTLAIAQARLVINGGIITISNGAALVIDNPNNTAITRNGPGYIQSEAAGNRIIWDIGTGNGNVYLLPFGNPGNYFPVQFTAASGIGPAGRFVFSTYPTTGWKNSDNLPPGVSNIISSGSDNSAKVIDRFWQISPEGYITKPTLRNLVFTYIDFEYSLPNNIKEGNLSAQRWNNSSFTWSDYQVPSVINTASNTITIPSVPGNQLYNWWTLSDIPPSATTVDVKAILYPNPAGSYINITVDPGIAFYKPAASIYDARGGLVMVFIITGITQQINVSALAAGVYQVHFFDKGIKHNLSFIKQ